MKTDVFLSERPGIEQETGILNDALEFSRAAARGVLNGALDAGKGNSVNRVASTMLGISKQSIANRLSRSKLIDQEAKIIDAAAIA